MRMQSEGKTMASKSNMLNAEAFRKCIRDRQCAVARILLHIGFSWIAVFECFIQLSDFISQAVVFNHVQGRRRFHQGLSSRDALERCLNSFLANGTLSRSL